MIKGYKTKLAVHFYQFPIDSSPDKFGFFKDLVIIYQNHLGSEDKPLWADFDFTEFSGYHSSINVSDVIEPFNLRYRIWGSALTGILGQDMTGKLFTDAFKTTDANAFLSAFANCVNTPCISLDWGPLPREHREFINFVAITFPISSDSENYDMLLQAVQPIGIAQEVPFVEKLKEKAIKVYII